MKHFFALDFMAKMLQSASGPNFGFNPLKGGALLAGGYRFFWEQFVGVLRGPPSYPARGKKVDMTERNLLRHGIVDWKKATRRWLQLPCKKRARGTA